MISLKTVLLVLFLILFTHALAAIGNWYWIVPWLDMPVHFAGGLWVALLFFYLNNKFFNIDKKFILFLTTVSFVSLIGVFWEFAEYIYSFLFSPKYYFFMKIGDVSDTLSDLLFDIFGALFFYGIYLIVDKILRTNRIEL